MRLPERTIAVPQDDKDAVGPEADDVREPAIGQVCEKSRMPVDPPILGGAEICEHGIGQRLSEGTVAVAQRDPNAVFAKSDDVGKPAICKVR